MLVCDIEGWKCQKMLMVRNWLVESDRTTVLGEQRLSNRYTGEAIDYT
jgi:hypothetical protein